MITSTQMYWLTRLDNLVALGIGAIIIAALLFGVGCIFILATTRGPDDEDVKPIFRRIVKWSLPPFLMGLFVVTFIPTTTQMAAIIVVPKIANSEKVQTVGNQLYDLAVEWMNELKPKNGKRVAQ